MQRGNLQAEFLQEQVSRAELTVNIAGAGFYVNFNVPEAADRISIDGNHKIGGVEASMDNLKHGIGLLLHLEHGHITCLEGFTYEESLPQTVSNLRVTEVDDGETTFQDLAKGFDAS